jgi:hypothetical protein
MAGMDLDGGLPAGGLEATADADQHGSIWRIPWQHEHNQGRSRTGAHRATFEAGPTPNHMIMIRKKMSLRRRPQIVEIVLEAWEGSGCRQAQGRPTAQCAADGERAADLEQGDAEMPVEFRIGDNRGKRTADREQRGNHVAVEQARRRSQLPHDDHQRDDRHADGQDVRSLARCER